MEPFILRGNFLWPAGRDALHTVPRGFGVCGADGRCAGVFEALPEAYAGLAVRDLGERLIIPGYCDLHFHAPQYQNLGLGMDLQLRQWLEEYTYPEEGRFSDLTYAETVYSALAAELRAGFTTRAAVFASAHRQATELLMALLDKTGLQTLVGKVNMDSAAPDYIRERDAAASLADTERWLSETEGRFANTKPILTPRFVPSCSPALLRGLGALARARSLPVQSHLDETPEEVQWVRGLCPDSDSYAAVYDGAGLLTGRTLMAHCIYMTPEECALMKARGAFAVHCPNSNTNVRTGIAPVRRYLSMGLNVGLGSDISGGHSLDMAETVRGALAASRLLWRMDGERLPHLTAAEAFYLATAGGGSFFGRVGRFEPGYEFDAVAVDDARWRGAADSLENRLSRLLYCARSSDVTAKYVAGRMLF